MSAIDKKNEFWLKSIFACSEILANSFFCAELNKSSRRKFILQLTTQNA